MSFLIDNDVKDRVRSAIDIVDLVGACTELRRQGRAFVARCPWHDDRKPSLQVNRERQSWKCWVCDIGGDIFSWVMQREGVSFPEALRMLAGQAGITLEPMQRAALASPGSGQDKKSLYESMKWVIGQYQEFLLHAKEAEPAREYLRQRGLHADSLQRFRLGLAPDQWTWLVDRARSQGISRKDMESINVAVKNDRGALIDRFRGRLMFPISDAQGRPIALGGRIIPGFSSGKEQAKYINTAETRLYSKNRQLYGLDLARDAIQRARSAVVVEGYTDVIMAHQHDITNAVAVCGTALGENHIRLLRHYCDSVTLLLDGDAAGQKRTNEILDLFVRAELDLRVLTLPENLDPCDYLLKYGGESLKAELGKTVDALEHKIRTVCRGFDPLIDTHRAAAALEDVLGTLALSPQMVSSVDPATKLRRDQILMRLARQFGIAEPTLRQRFQQLQQNLARTQRGRYARVTDAGSQAAEPEHARPSLHFRDLTPLDRELFEILVLYPEIVPIALERFPSVNLGSETGRYLLQAYVEIELAGYELDCSSVMSAVEDPAVKSLLVSLEEEATRKVPHIRLSGQQRFQALCEKLDINTVLAERPQHEGVLASKKLDEKEEIDLLQQIFDQARERPGLIVFPNSSH